MNLHELFRDYQLLYQPERQAGEVLDPTTVDAIDPHTHTFFSDGNDTPIAMVDAAEGRGIQEIIITDHDKTVGSEAVTAQLDVERQTRPYRPRTRVATEVSTTLGHILAYEVQGPIPWGLSPQDTIFEIHQQGGKAVIAHPGFPYYSLPWEEINALYEKRSSDSRPDGIEIFNAGVARFGRIMGRLPVPQRYRRDYNREAMERYKREPEKYGIAIGSSDAHAREAVGSGLTLVRKGEDIFHDPTALVGIMQRRSDSPVRFTGVIMENLRGVRLDYERRRA